MVVQHNMQAANANRMLNVTTSAQSKSTEKLSSGYRINRAADDAAGLTISEKMRKQIKGLDRSSTNAEDGVSAVQTAEGALTEVHSMLQRMNELATQSANGTNSNTDRKAIQDEIDQLTTEIDRVSETTKFNETYLLKGDGAEKAHNVNAHDAGLDGVTLTDKGDTVEVTLKELNAGDKISIAGKNYTIGSTVDEAKAIVKASADATKKSYTINGTTYQADNAKIYKDGKELKKSDLGATGADKDDPATINDLQGLVTGGSTVSDGTKTLTAMKDGTNDGIDDNDSTVITAKKAYQLETAEILKASNIGTDTAATADKNTGTLTDATNKFTLTKGKVNYNDALSFNLHVGADADMTNKITVNIDSMNSAGLGVKGIKADTEQDATYAIDAIADAISTVSSQRSALGAVQNRLEHTINNLDNVVENTTSAESRIRDTDMAEEMVNYSKNNILAQAGQSMLAQANQSNQGVLSLLQ
ncbi:flagellar hook protein [Agathobacter rectalis]|uniref:flagellin N-terminal helical domain-containing protein n=1 Tax=Agathobacter rectalis TaxID=39491 RepID=UPI000E4F2E15|nr:flagellin [Agathobacter rectalis]RGR63477.1 flagellar hook protein [Agathobacter rectalis]